MSKKSRKNGGPRSGAASTPASRRPRSASSPDVSTSSVPVAKATPAPAAVTILDTPPPANARTAARADGDRDTLITPLSPMQSPAAASATPSAVTVAAATSSKKSKGKKGSSEAAKASDAVDDGETSIPPAVDLDEQFFSERAPKIPHLDFHADDLGLDANHDPRFAHKMSPAVRARRQRFAGYVKIAVGVCGAVVLAAVVRVAGGNAHDVEPVNVASAMTSMPTEPALPEPQPQHTPPTVTVEPAAPAAEAALEPVPAVVAEAPKPVEAAPAPVSAASAAPAVSVAAEPASEAPAKSARDEKKDARTALERGQTKKAIEAGERSVALDATDGEAWLLLGAAYQEAGKAADAHRAFASCAKEGKKGPIGECRAMLR